MKQGAHPLSELLKHLDAWGRAALPATATALAMILAAAPVGLPSAVPALLLCCLFFWSVFRPAALPPPLCGLLGLLQDLLVFAPVGTGVLIALLMQGAALRLRRVLARQAFWTVWLAFAAFALAATLLGHGLQAVLTWRLPQAAAAVVQLLLAIGFYPPVAALLTRLHRSMQRAEDLA
ncbi:rod shape-determining protein MreD [Teichococcus vastitatis]|uniref:Rod shape-determining protein MreD n=1 Tax=Teichococcus vastitatis TaxID=2307076 RepID=A0ABS9W4R2_9PROT|nr:rod shape-determining protein MreD [Pseudoroseomonas vastitatis]MCI0754198.1 rod shape-determining protein MreD [Pseudoroseomonas vastitatis]